MIRKRTMIAVFVLLIFINLKIWPQSVRRVLFNGKIFSGKNGTLSEAVVFEKDKIIFVGTNFGAEKFRSGSNVESLDLKGKIVLPGFHDADMNFLLGAGLLENSLNFFGLDLDSVVHRLKIERKKKQTGAIYGYNYEHLLIKNRKWPNKYDLDKVSRELPVIVYSSDGNTAWVNSSTLKICGIGKDTPEVPGGRIIRFEDNDPSGILSGNSLELLKNYEFRKSIRRISPDKNKIMSAMKYLNKLGLTSVTTLGTLELIKMLRELESEGKLNVRFNIILPSKHLGRYLISKVEFNTGNPFLKIVSLTKEVDGNLYTSDAAMFSAYWKSWKYGFLRTNKNDISDMVSLYNNSGIVGDFHAEGDRAVNIVMNGIQSALLRYSNNHHRHRISNLVFIIKEDISRLKGMDLIPVMHPTSFQQRFELIEKLVGKRKIVDAFRARTLLRSGATIAFGSGWPGESPDPLSGIKFIVFPSIRGKTGEEFNWFLEEKLSINEAIRAYTYGPSYSIANDQVCGSIEKGKFADFVIIDGNIFSEDLDTDSFSSEIKVSETIIGGRTVFRNKYLH